MARNGLLERMFGRFSPDLAIDLGTANTLVFQRGKGVVVNEPSVVAVAEGIHGPARVLAVGSEAKQMLGRTPGSIKAIRPMKDGVIADFDITGAMIKDLIRRACPGRMFLRPRIVIAVPSQITQVERRAVREAAEQAGAREVYLIEEPMAAAIGAGLPITESVGNLIVDIGGGTTDVAVISLAGIVYAHSARVGGDKLDEAIITYVKRRHNLLIGERTAEEIKIQVGTALPDTDGPSMEIKGRDLVAGVPKTVRITSEEAYEAMLEQIRAIVEAVRQTLECTPPELSGDIVERGIVLAGGGGSLRNLDKLLTQETGLPVHVAKNSLLSVAEGSGLVLENIDLLRQIAIG